MQAIILAGGLGTRLRSVLTDVPKPMAPIHHKPFLAYLLDYLKEQGFKRVIFSLYYQSEKIRDYFRTHYAGIEIDYVEEEQPLGTGGAIVNALTVLQDKERPVFVLNGDTFVALQYQHMHAQHARHGAALTLALKSVAECSRYGKVVIQDKQVIAFREKGEQGAGWINAGVYLLHPQLFSSFHLAKHFSFENDFLQPHLATLKPQAFTTHDYFIDIGIPEDYARAVNDLPKRIESS